MRKVDGYWLDESTGNKWEAAPLTHMYGLEPPKSGVTLAEANKLAKTMTDCKNCADCADCIRCDDCSDCEGCEDCYSCNDCFYCEGCHNCAECYKCWNCLNCKECDQCEVCTECTYCQLCKTCKTSQSCYHSDLLEACKNVAVSAGDVGVTNSDAEVLIYEQLREG